MIGGGVQARSRSSPETLLPRGVPAQQAALRRRPLSTRLGGCTKLQARSRAGAPAPISLLPRSSSAAASCSCRVRGQTRPQSIAQRRSPAACRRRRPSHGLQLHRQPRRGVGRLGCRGFTARDPALRGGHAAAPRGAAAAAVARGGLQPLRLRHAPGGRRRRVRLRVPVLLLRLGPRRAALREGRAPHARLPARVPRAARERPPVSPFDGPKPRVFLRRRVAAAAYHGQSAPRRAPPRRQRLRGAVGQTAPHHARMLRIHLLRCVCLLVGRARARMCVRFCVRVRVRVSA